METKAPKQDEMKYKADKIKKERESKKIFKEDIKL